MARPESRLDHGPADERRVGTHDGLGHADILRPVGEVDAVERHRLEDQLPLELSDVRFGRDQVKKQDVPCLYLDFPERSEHGGAPAACAFHGEHVGPERAAQAERLERAAHYG